MNLVDFQYLFDLKENFNNVSLQRFYKKYQRINIGSFHDFIIGHCVVGASFLRINRVKSPVRSLLSNSHLKNLLCIGTLSITPDIVKLVGNKQFQTSH